MPTRANRAPGNKMRSEEHTSELQSPYEIVCRLLLEKKKGPSSGPGIRPLFEHAYSDPYPAGTTVCSTFHFNATATTAIYTLSLHDALPISAQPADRLAAVYPLCRSALRSARLRGDRKSTRLNSSHRTISYAVFCLKKK